MTRVICKRVTEYMKGYINSKYMNMSTFCEIKYMYGLVFFSNVRYMIGVGFKIVAHKPIPKLPQGYPIHVKYEAILKILLLNLVE